MWCLKILIFNRESRIIILNKVLSLHLKRILQLLHVAVYGIALSFLGVDNKFIFIKSIIIIKKIATTF